MDLLKEAKQGNRVFRLSFPTGETVVFRLLSWDSFNKYWELEQKGTLASDIIEDAIFRECCLDQVCIENSYNMRAGVISTIVGIIKYLSGPVNTQNFNNDMDIARTMVDTLNSQIVIIICRAFPAYKPEDIMDMPWSTVLTRLAQAERILMKKNPPEMTEPLRQLTPEEQAEKVQKQGQVDVNKLVQDGRRDAAEAGLRSEERSSNNISEADLKAHQETIIRQKRRAMARQFDR